MDPLEKYIPNKDNGSPEGDVRLKTSGDKRGERVLEKLKKFEKNNYEKLRKETIAKAVRDVKADDNDDDFDPAEAKKRDGKLRKERTSNYREMLNDEKEVSTRDFAYGEMTTYEFNSEAFRGEGGWLEEYNKTDASKKQSIEEFILDKQYDELEKIRVNLSEVRVRDSVPKIYKDLEGTDKKAERQKKNKEVNKAVKSYFKENKKGIDDYINGEPEKADGLKKDLLSKFKKNVFGDVKENQSEENTVIESLFNELITDYSAMLDQKEYLKQLNPQMVAGLLDESMDKSKWNSLLGKEAQKQAKKMEEVNKEKAQEVKVDGNPLSSPDANKLFYGNDAAVLEKLGPNSTIVFEQIGPGQYKIKFPGDSTDQFSIMTVKQVVGEDGKKKDVYLFKDPLLDHNALVENRGFKSQVNGLFLDHVMNDSIKPGKDYLGPGLNDILHDKEMYSLAEELFYPKKLTTDIVEPRDTLVFKNLMLVLTSTANNAVGEGIYGNLQAIRTRISLLQFSFGLDGGNKARTFYENLVKAKPEDLKNMSIEQLCKISGIEKNSGNFAKG